MLAIYYLPATAAVFRLIVTLMMLIFASDGFHFKVIQLVSLCIIAASCFRQYRLFVDGIPVISLTVPTILQCVLSAAFFGEVPLFQVVFIALFDLIFLFTKGYKPTQIPFQIDEPEEENFGDLVD